MSGRAVADINYNSDAKLTDGEDAGESIICLSNQSN